MQFTRDQSDSVWGIYVIYKTPAKCQRRKISCLSPGFLMPIHILVPHENRGKNSFIQWVGAKQDSPFCVWCCNSVYNTGVVSADRSCSPCTTSFHCVDIDGATSSHDDITARMSSVVQNMRQDMTSLERRLELIERIAIAQRKQDINNQPVSSYFSWQINTISASNIVLIY